MAAIHWYDPEIRDFRDFLSWRKMDPGHEDFFKKQLVEYSRVVHSLELDNIEAGLVNVLVIIAKGTCYARVGALFIKILYN